MARPSKIVARAIEPETHRVDTFLQEELAGIDLSELIADFFRQMGASTAVTAENLRKYVAAESPSPEMEKIAAWVLQHETIHRFRIHEVIARYLEAYREAAARKIQCRKIKK